MAALASHDLEDLLRALTALLKSVEVEIADVAEVNAKYFPHLGKVITERDTDPLTLGTFKEARKRLEKCGLLGEANRIEEIYRTGDDDYLCKYVKSLMDSKQREAANTSTESSRNGVASAIIALNVTVQPPSVRPRDTVAGPEAIEPNCETPGFTPPYAATPPATPDAAGQTQVVTFPVTESAKVSTVGATEPPVMKPAATVPAKDDAELPAVVQPAEKPVVAAERLVTLLQAASMVNKVKNTLVKRAKRSPLPLPEVEGGGGRSAEWKWSVIRPWLENEFCRILPERFPDSPFVRRQ